MTGRFSQSSLHGCPYTAIIDKIIRLVFNNPIVVTTSDNPRPMAVFHIPDSRFLAKCNTGKRETYPYSQPLFGKERRFQTIAQLILIRMTKCRDFYRRAGQLKTAFQRSFPNIQLLTRFTQFSLRKRLSFHFLQTDQSQSRLMGIGTKIFTTRRRADRIRDFLTVSIHIFEDIRQLIVFRIRKAMPAPFRHGR